jgi:hypothetical protein
MRLLLVVACALAIVPAASGFVIAGERWPGSTVSVWNATGYPLAERDAMRAWNGAGARIRLVPAASRAEADVLIRYGPVHDQGESTVGYAPGGSTVELARGLGRVVATAIATHELGHVLGLGHETRGCTVMAPVVDVGATSRCRIGTCKKLWRCLLRRDDVAGVRALYGRRNAS